MANHARVEHLPYLQNAKKVRPSGIPETSPKRVMSHLSFHFRRSASIARPCVVLIFSQPDSRPSVQSTKNFGFFLSGGGVTAVFLASTSLRR
jgi:hypothetical protein